MQLTTILYPNRAAYKFQWNICNHFFVFNHFKQVHMDQVVGNFVELQFFHYTPVCIAIQFYFGKLKIWCIHQRFECNGSSREVDLLFTPVNYTRHIALRAKLAGSSFAKFGSQLSFDCNRFHLLFFLLFSYAFLMAMAKSSETESTLILVVSFLLIGIVSQTTNSSSTLFSMFS